IAVATSSIPMPRLASDVGSSWTRTAYFCAPYTTTCAIPGVIEICCAITVSPYSSSCDSGIVLDVSARYRIGESAGFTLRYDGGRMPSGSLRRVCEIAAFTSCAAASMSRSRVNWIVIDVDPSWLVDVMLSMPAIVENCFSSGVATDDAIVSGLAPGRFALTLIVGKSTDGRSLTGSRWYETTPKNRMATMTRVVMIGRRMNNAVIVRAPVCWYRSPVRQFRRAGQQSTAIRRAHPGWLRRPCWNQQFLESLRRRSPVV